MSAKLVPKLRFPEFIDHLIIRKFGDFLKINQGLQINISERFLTKRNETYKFYITNEFLRVGAKKKFFIRNPPNSVICEEEDILMTRTGNTGQVVTGVSGAFHNNFFKIKYPEEIVQREYLVHFLRLLSTQRMILRLAGTSTIPDLNHSDFYRINIPLPSLPEQKKIADFLGGVDEKLNKLRRKHELLTTYKRGAMQQIFSQKIRFKTDTGEDFPDWEETTIGEVGYFYYGKSAPKFSLADDAPTPCVRYGELYNKYGVIIDEVVSRTTIDPSQLKFSRGGEILVPRVGEDPLDFSKCCLLKQSKIAIGEMISVFNTKENSLFYTYYFRNLTKQFARVVEGGNVSNLYYAYLMPIQIGKPHLEEQQKIADFLSSIDTKIDAVSKQITQMENFKKGLLQQMFV